jgi:site-specific DNA-methyltransferase (adenine-specific)
VICPTANYGTTACKWDTIIPFNKHIKEINNRGKEIILYRDEYILQEVKKGKSYKDTTNYFDNNAIDGLWDNYNRIIKDRGAIVLFGSEPFSSYLRMSNIKQFRYDWIWDKVRPSGFQIAKYNPMKRHEIISVFQDGSNWYPQKEKRDKPVKGRVCSSSDSSPLKYNDGKVRVYDEKNPQSIIVFSKQSDGKYIHPTQKPVALLEYLIKTYTLEGETVLDNTMGSGSTGVACLNTKRNFIGIEKDDTYFEIAKKRIEEAKKDNETKLF